MQLTFQKSSCIVILKIAFTYTSDFHLKAKGRLKILSFFKFLKRIPSWVTEVVILFFLSWTPFFWLKSDQVILGHDAGFRLDMTNYLRDLWYSWTPSPGFGADWTLNKGFLIAQTPETFFTFVTNDVSLGQRLSFVFWFFMIGLSMYIFVKHFFPRKEFFTFRIFSSLFYMYNFFLLQGWFITERGKFSLYVALPLGLLILYETLLKKIPPLKGATLFGLIFFFFNGGGSPPLYGAILVVYSVSFFYLSFVNIWQNGAKGLLHSLKTIFLFGVITVLLNSYWIIPQIQLAKNQYGARLAASGGIESILNWEKTVSKNASLINLFRLQGIPDWYDSPNHTYSRFFLENPLLIVLSFLPISLILLGLFLHHRFRVEERNDHLFFLILLILIVSCLFAAGSHDPFGSIYLLFIKYIPGFAIFRSAIYKFGPGVWFSIIFLSGYSLNFLLLHLRSRKKLSLVITSLSIFTLLAYHFPFFTHQFFQFDPPFGTRVAVPKYVIETAGYMNKNASSDSRLLLLPKLYPSFPVDSYKWGFWSFDLLPRLSFSHSVIVNEAGAPPIIDSLYKAADQQNLLVFNRISQMLGVNYVLWRSDILYHDKKTQAKEFSDNLFSPMNANHPESVKDFNEWQLYPLTTSSKLFSTHQRATLTQISGSGFAKVLESEPVMSPGKLYLDQADLEETALSRELSLDSAYIIEAHCLNCHYLTDPNFPLFGVSFPFVRFLPNSLIYPYVIFKENEALANASNSPVKKIDTGLLFADKRINEVSFLLQEHQDARLAESLQATINRYKSLIATIQTELPELSGLTQRENQTKLLSHLYAHQKLLYQSSGVSSELSEFVQATLRSIEEEDSIIQRTGFLSSAEAVNVKKFLISVPVSGTYEVHLVNTDVKKIKSLWQGKEVDLSNELSLEVGEYQLEIIYPKAENLTLSRPVEISGKLQEKNSERVGFNIQDFDHASEYFISFEYFSQQEQSTSFSILQDNDPQPEKYKLQPKTNVTLKSNGQWNTYTHFFVPNEYAKEVNLFITSFNSEGTNPEIEIRNFEVKKIATLDVFLVKQASPITSKNLNSEKIPISFTTLNPTKHLIHLNTAPESFFLHFNQSYNPGWALYPAGTPWWQTLWKKSIAADAHFIGNTYANTWYLKNAQHQDLIVFYRPQAVFYAAALISTIMIVFSTSYLILITRKRK